MYVKRKTEAGRTQVKCPSSSSWRRRKRFRSCIVMESFTSKMLFLLCVIRGRAGNEGMEGKKGGSRREGGKAEMYFNLN